MYVPCPSQPLTGGDFFVRYPDIRLSSGVVLGKARQAHAQSLMVPISDENTAPIRNSRRLSAAYSRA